MEIKKYLDLPWLAGLFLSTNSSGILNCNSFSSSLTDALGQLSMLL